MKQEYTVKGSNTLYKVWGILVLIFGIITGIFFLFDMVIAIVAMGSDTGKFLLSVNEKATGMTVAFTILTFLIMILMVVVKINTGRVLVKQYYQSTANFIFYAVLYFLSAVGWLVIMIVVIALGSIMTKYIRDVSVMVAFEIIYYIIKISWDVATGIILVSKHGKSVVIGTGGFEPNPIHNPISNPIPTPVPQPIPGSVDYVIGTIEGLYGDYRGRKFELRTGVTCKIGRESSCDIQINHPKVSRLHCTVRKLPNGKYCIVDYSSNGTFYENNRLNKNMEMQVSPGGMLVVGEADNVLLLR